MKNEYIKLYNILINSKLTETLYYDLVSTYGKSNVDGMIEKIVEDNPVNFFKYEVYCPLAIYPLLIYDDNY